MNPWQHLCKIGRVIRYWTVVMEKGYQKDMFWCWLEDHSRMLDAMAQGLKKQMECEAGIKDLALKMAFIQEEERQKREGGAAPDPDVLAVWKATERLEASQLATLQRGAETERRLVLIQEEMARLLARVEEIRGGRGFSHQPSPELELLADLQEVMPHRTALDIGAHLGVVSARLLDLGFRVHAFEPHPDLHRALEARFKNHSSFTAHGMAVGGGDDEGILNLVGMNGTGATVPDLTLFSSLASHPLPEGMSYSGILPVKIRSLESLHREGLVPEDVDLVKIDAEGEELRVLQGMGNRVYNVVLAEFWSDGAVFGSAKGGNRLEDMVSWMKGRGYRHHIVLSCRDGESQFQYFPELERAPLNSWGNVIFFHQPEPFQRALTWCGGHLVLGFVA